MAQVDALKAANAEASSAAANGGLSDERELSPEEQQMAREAELEAYKREAAHAASAAKSANGKGAAKQPAPMEEEFTSDLVA